VTVQPSKIEDSQTFQYCCITRQDFFLPVHFSKLPIRKFTNLFSFLVVPKRSYGPGKHFRMPTLNDLPTPAGDFFALDAARQRTNNIVLGLGIVMFTSTLYIVRFLETLY
jgi:Deltamethrin resistance